MKYKKTIIIFGLLLILSILSFFIFYKVQESPENTLPKEFSMYSSINPLVLFRFKVEGEKAFVTSFELANDKSKEIFNDTDFLDMELMYAIELYGDKATEANITFTTINIWTTWDNKDYFQSDKYHLNISIVDNDFLQKVPETIKAELQLHKNYYLIGDEHNYRIVFKENGKLEFHIDTHETELCDEWQDCSTVTIEEETFTGGSEYVTYTLKDNELMIQGDDIHGYQGWIYAYDKCEILYNRIKCDYYNGFHSTIPKYVSTSYYEIRD